MPMAMCNEYPPPGMAGGRGLEGLPLLIDSMGGRVDVPADAGGITPTRCGAWRGLAAAAHHGAADP